jgi:hypothetical protein
MLLIQAHPDTRCYCVMHGRSTIYAVCSKRTVCRKKNVPPGSPGFFPPAPSSAELSSSLELTKLEVDTPLLARLSCVVSKRTPAVIVGKAL